MLLVYLVDLFVLREHQHAKEDLPLLGEVGVDGALLHKGVDGLVELRPHLLANRAVLVHGEENNDVVGSWILQHELSVGLGSELDDVSTELSLKLLDLGQSALALLVQVGLRQLVGSLRLLGTL